MEVKKKRQDHDFVNRTPLPPPVSLPLWPSAPAHQPLQAPVPESHVTFQVHGLSHTSGVGVIEQLLHAFEGVRQVRVDAETGQGEMLCAPVPPLPEVQQTFQAHGYSILPQSSTPRPADLQAAFHPNIRVTFQVQGIRRASCVVVIDRRLHTLAGVKHVRVDARTGRGSLLCTHVPPLESAQELLQVHGYTILPESDTPRPSATASHRKRYTVRNVLTMGIHTISPGWFTSVMGTGILAVCLTLSPIRLPVFDLLAQVLWISDVFLFGMLLLSPSRIRASLQESAHAQLWGAPPVACFTVATGFLLIGNHLLSSAIALPCAQVLWLLGVAGSLFSATAVPYVMMTRHDLTTEATYGSWLLPVAPPIVAPVCGALLAAHWPVVLRSDMLALSYMLWGVGMALTSILLVLFYARLVYHKIPAGPLVPTLWIVVGPLGQSVASLTALGNVAPTLWPTVGPALHAAALVYGFPVWGFGMYWLLLALLVTLRAASRHLPFNLGWWAFVFPVGTLTAGTYGLYARTHPPLFAGAGVLLLCLLALMWTLVASQTLCHLGKALKRGAHG